MITIKSPASIDEIPEGIIGLQKVILSSGEDLVLTTTGLDAESEFTVHDTKGRLMLERHIPITHSSTSIAIGNLPSGMYIYQIVNDKQKFFGKFIVK